MSNPIGEILSNRIGLRHGYQFRENDFTENGIQVIKIGNVTDDGLKLDTDVSFVSADRVREFENIIIKNGDILMSLTGNIGRVVEVQNLNGKILFQNYRVGVFYPLDEDVYKPFIKWVLSSEAILRQLSNYSNQSAQANFGKQDLDKLRFVFPKHKNQRQIAKILSTADSVIEKTQAAIAKYKAIKQGMLQDLFTRGIDLNTNKLRPRYEDAPELYKESKLGMIPREWEVISIENFAVDEKNAIVDGPFGSNLKTIHYRSSGVPVIQSGFVTSNVFKANSYLYVDEEKFESEIRSKAEPGDIIIAKIGAQCGTCAILPDNHPVSILAGNSMKITVAKHNSAKFLESLLQHLYSIGGLADIILATAQPAVSMASFKVMSIIYPEPKEQFEIAKRIERINKAIQTEQTYLQKMQSIKKGLMEDLLSGRKQVIINEAQ